MTIFTVITLLGGLAMFLYGMEIMGEGLKNASGTALKRVLEKVTANAFMGVLTGSRHRRNPVVHRYNRYHGRTYYSGSFKPQASRMYSPRREYRYDSHGTDYTPYGYRLVRQRYSRIL